MSELRSRLRSGLHYAIAPLAYTVLFAIIAIAWKSLHLPAPEEFYIRVVKLYEDYGVIAIAVAAFIEGLMIINLYLPGSAVIILGVATARGHPGIALQVVLITSLMFIVTSILNYLIGYSGLHAGVRKVGGSHFLDRANIWYSRYGARAIVISCFHPNFASFVSAACGIARFPLKKFIPLITISTLTWCVAWGFMAYQFSGAVQSVITHPSLMLVLLSVWTSVAFLYGIFKRTHGPTL